MAKDLHGSCRSSQHSAFSLCAPADGRRSAADGRRKVVKNSRVVFQESAQGSRFQRLPLLKQGFAFAELGDKVDARLILQELVDRYPQAPEAGKAKQKLKALES